MRKVSRRTFLSGTATLGGAAAAATAWPGIATAAPPPAARQAVAGSVTIGPADPQYLDLVRGHNMRWVGSPDKVRVVTSTAEVESAVRDAVRAGERVAVRSGGHCYEDFVTSADVRVVIDVSQLTAVYFDAARNAFAVEAGAPLGAVYKTLYEHWGVTIPGGSCPTVAAGGHIAGGGYGPLNRAHGLTVDHLYAVEVVVVDAAGTVRTVVATGRRSDPNRDLWWAHTGGGGGNFGIVTRYWFRTPGSTGTDPGGLLPRPPAEMLVSSVSWPWSGLTEAAFTRLMTNFGAWHEANSAADSPYAGMFSEFAPAPSASGSVGLDVQIDASLPGVERLLADFITAVGAGVGVPPFVSEHRRLPWLRSTAWIGRYTGGPTYRSDFKSAYQRTGFTARQIAAFYHHLTRADYRYPFARVGIASYGGRTNTVPPSATAVPQRDSIMKLQYMTAWTDPAEDALHIGWLREFYRDVYADTGGVPVPNAVSDGCFVNYADIDLGDPAWNTSAVPWHDLYYKGNYPALQQAKARWDPRDIFRHAQSVRAPATGGGAR